MCADHKHVDIHVHVHVLVNILAIYSYVYMYMSVWPKCLAFHACKYAHVAEDVDPGLWCTG